MISVARDLHVIVDYDYDYEYEYDLHAAARATVAQDVLAAKMHAVMCEMRARQQRQADRKRVREAAAADGELAPTAPNGVPRGTLRVATHTISNFRTKFMR